MSKKIILGKVKEDCFAYKDKKCTALDKLYCKYERETCPFYKTEKENKEQIIMSTNRYMEHSTL